MADDRNELPTMRKRRSFAAKALTICVMGLMLGLGLCGAGTFVNFRHPDLQTGLFIGGFISFWGALLGSVVVIIGVWVASVVRERRR